MLMTEMTHELLEIIRHAHIVDDDNIDLRLLEQFIRIQRSFWITNTMDKSQRVNESNAQDFVFELSRINSSTDSILQSDDSILRSIDEIPEFISNRINKGVILIDSPDLLNPSFSMVSIGRMPWVGSSRHNGQSIFVSLYSQNIYARYGKNALSDLALTKLRVKGYFEDPEDVPGFDIDIMEYPISGKIWALVKDAVLKTDLRELITKPVDKINDADGTEL